jgi:ADP-heptose:LPS heptosyltransferase
MAQTSEPMVGAKIGALAELNTVAANSDAVFVFLPGKSDASAKTPSAQIQGAARTIESQGYKIALFTLKTDSRDYEQVAAQIPVPGVLALVKGRGMSAVSGEITEPKLIQGFVAASSAGGCGAGGCGPARCN